MAGTYIGKYDTTAANNTATSTGSVSVAEGMLPSNINNAFRDLMADIRQFYNSSEWIEYGDGAGTYTPAYASSTSFTIAGVDVTSVYHVGRRVKIVASTPGTIYGSITATAFSTNTTVTVAFDSGSLSNEAITSVHIGAISATNTSIPETLPITGDYTLDVSGDIILDADGANVTIKDGGTTTLDIVSNGATDVTLDAPGDIHLDADGGDIKFYDGGTQFGEITNSSTDLVIKSTTSDKDVIIKGNDGGSAINALSLDMSAAGAASFNDNVTVGGDLTVTGDDIFMNTNTSGAALIADGTNFNPVVISGDISIGTTGTAAIGSGVIVNADVSSSAAIAFSKMEDLTASRALYSNGSGDVTVSDVTSTELGYLDGVSSAIQTQLDAKQATITGSATTIDTESLTANRAVISNGSQKIAVSDVTSTELGYLDGVSSAIQTQLDAKAATSYVDDAVAGLRTRIIVEAATTANVTLSSDLQNGDTIDGVTLATGDQVLVKNQSTDSQNGIYTVVSSGTASRSTEYDAIAEISGQIVVVNQGTTNDNTLWLCTTNSSATLGSDSISFTKITPQNVGNVTLTGTQTLTNKTLTSPVINSPTGDFLKIEGTNFTDSLLVGHATTGTLDAAEDNTGVGIGALDALTSGDRNTALGSEAGTAITTANNNTLIGYEAGKGVVGANQNTAIGDNAFAGTNTDSNSASNTVLGAFAMNVSSGAKENTAIGRDAGREVTTGDGNIFLGYNAGANDSTAGITTGSGNVIIGTVDPASRTGDRQLKIAGNDGSTTTTWISGDSSGNVTVAGTLTTSAGAVAASGDVTALAIALG